MCIPTVQPLRQATHSSDAHCWWRLPDIYQNTKRNHLGICLPYTKKKKHLWHRRGKQQVRKTRFVWAVQLFSARLTFQTLWPWCRDCIFSTRISYTFNSSFYIYSGNIFPFRSTSCSLAMLCICHTPIHCPKQTRWHKCLTFRGALREERCTEEGTEALQCTGQCGSTTTEEEASILEKTDQSWQKNILLLDDDDDDDDDDDVFMFDEYIYIYIQMIWKCPGETCPIHHQAPWKRIGWHENNDSVSFLLNLYDRMMRWLMINN